MKFLAIASMAAAIAASQGSNAKAMSAAAACPGHVQAVYFYRGATRKWEAKMDKPLSKSNFNASTVHSCKYTIWTAHLWARRAKALRLYYKLKWLPAQIPKVDYGTWDCIHRHEGAWTSNTGNGYYGGLQMDAGFMRTYGPEFLERWGTADNWPAWAQITAATRARDSGRGYTPWPNTARACGQL